jgi:hypothetical protein
VYSPGATRPTNLRCRGTEARNMDAANRS